MLRRGAVSLCSSVAARSGGATGAINARSNSAFVKQTRAPFAGNVFQQKKMFSMSLKGSAPAKEGDMLFVRKNDTRTTSLLIDTDACILIR